MLTPNIEVLLMTDLEASSRGEDSDGEVGPRVVRFKTYYWNYEETDDHELLIHVGGRTEDGKIVHSVIKGFTPFVYLQLPKRIKWNKAKCIAVFEYLKKLMPIDFALWFEWQSGARSLNPIGAAGTNIPLTDSGSINLDMVKTEEIVVDNLELEQFDLDDISGLSKYLADHIALCPDYPKPRSNFTALPVLQ